MILCVLGFSNAEARKGSTISPNNGEVFRYFDFHTFQSVPIRALLQPSMTSMSLDLRSESYNFNNLPIEISSQADETIPRGENIK